VHQASAPVDLAALEREPLLAPEAGEADEDRNRAVSRPEFGGEGLEVGDRLEGEHFAPLRLGVRHRTATFSSSSFARTA
jgi:hypothetical protein